MVVKYFTCISLSRYYLDVMDSSNNYIQAQNTALYRLFYDSFKSSLSTPSLAWFTFRTILWQKKAVKTRQTWETQGIHVPPVMIMSITGRCNLFCKGCYSHAHARSASEELTSDTWRSIIAQADELGVSVVLLSGGEPLLRPDILDLAAGYGHIVFPVFTNGQLLTAEKALFFKQHKNLVPIVSLEGLEQATDERRGPGTFKAALSNMEHLKTNGIFFGVSLTITSRNFDDLTGDGFIQTLVRTGGKLFYFIEYVPFEENTNELALANQQRTRLESITKALQAKFKRVFVTFPGDEEIFGGCLAAGRGFIHVSPNGSLEPCPFAPYTDTNLKNTPLKTALQSEFLKKIRENPEHLTETRGGCALWNNREWVQSLLSNPQR